MRENKAAFNKSKHTDAKVVEANLKLGTVFWDHFVVVLVHICVKTLLITFIRATLL